MTPALARRGRITTVTIAVSVIVALLSAPTAVLSIVLGGDDQPLPPAPSAVHLSSGKTASPGNQFVQEEMRQVQAGRPAFAHHTFDERIEPDIDDLEHYAEELLGDLPTGDDPFELTQIPIALDGDGLLGGFDFPQDGFGFPRTGLPFAGAGFGAVRGFGAASGGSAAAGDGSAAAGDGSAAAGDGSAAAGDGSGAGGVSGSAAGGSGASASGGSGGTDDSGSTERSPEARGGHGDRGKEEGGLGPLPKYPEVPGKSGPAVELPPSSAGPVAPLTPVAVPEPGSLVLMGLGLAGLVARSRRAARAGRRRAGLADSDIAEKHESNRR